jgi:hypothetical protein
MLFRLVSTRTEENTRTTYGQSEYVRTGASITNIDSNNVLRGGIRTLSNNREYSFKLESDIITTADYQAFSNLIASSEVYFMLDNKYYPVTITDRNWTEKIQSVDKIFTATVTVKLGKKYNSQFK